MSESVEKCEVCIVGAGLAGMNALFVASRYLARDQRVILVDRRQQVGGMWVDTYPYVRLHQPHGVFTAGNIKWTLGRERGYLASKGEVLDHFEHCRQVIEQDQRVDEFFGWTMESDEEFDGGVRVRCRAADGRSVTIETKKLIKAYGFQVEGKDPLPLTSQSVKSVSPDDCDMRSGPLHDDTAPVWVIGGGKTAMDTVYTLSRACPGREVNLLAGGGTFFSNRKLLFAEGRSRWLGAATPGSGLVAECAARFDGTNEDEVWDWHRSNYGLAVTPEVGNYVAGLLSEAEQRAILSACGQVVTDHLVDVVDTESGPQLLLRSGASVAVQPGSWFVNCTGYLTHLHPPYEPYTSSSGNTLSIQSRSATMSLTSFGAYFGTHLLLSGQLRDVPLYELDTFELYRRSRKAFPYTLFALVQHNMSHYADALPMSAFRECGLDFDLWYPLPRRLFTLLQFMRTHRADRVRARQVLDTVHDRFDVRCGPLTFETQKTS